MSRPLTLRDILNPLDNNQIANKCPSPGVHDAGACESIRFKEGGETSSHENDVVITAVTPLQKSNQGVLEPEATKRHKQNPKPGIAKLLDVSQIHLEGEDSGTVPIYDTCDGIRRKIRAFLRRDGVTQASLLRALSKCRPLEDRGKIISATSYQKFMRQTGYADGAGSVVFYTGYVFFEKMRLRDGKPKTKFREEMERVWGDSEDPMTGRRGFTPKRGWLLVHESQAVWEDRYGMLHFLPKGEYPEGMVRYM